MRRRWGVAVAGGVIALLFLAGAVQAARDPHDPTLRRVAADQAMANRLVVLRSDLPMTFKDTGVDTNTSNTCSYDPDFSRYVATGRTDGHSFTRKTNTGVAAVQSLAIVFRTASDAQAFFRRDAVERRSVHCIVEYFGKDIAQVKMVPTHLTTEGTRQVVWQMVAKYQHGQGATLPMVSAASAIVRGRVVIEIVVIQLGEPVMSLQTAATMSMNLGQRLNAAKIAA